jgi:hypothetical protein
MDRELIIRLAREAGLKLFNDGWTSSDNGDAVTEESLERFAALVAAHERKQALAEPERKPLTDDEIAQAMFRAHAIVTGPMQFRFAREIERAHGIRSRDV